MKEQLKTCVACNCVDEVQHYSDAGTGPFCDECWAALTDADQSLLLEKRLEQAEATIEQLRNEKLSSAEAAYVLRLIKEGLEYYRLLVGNPNCAPENRLKAEMLEAVWRKLAK